jgi:hypothetical protein
VVVALAVSAALAVIVARQPYPDDMIYICEKALTIDLWSSGIIDDPRPRACAGVDDATIARLVARIHPHP